MPGRPIATAEDVVKEDRLKLKTVRGTENVADHLTKPKSKVEIEELLKKIGAKFEEYFDGSGAGPPSKRRCSLAACIMLRLMHAGGSLPSLLSLVMHVYVKRVRCLRELCGSAQSQQR